MDRRSILKGFGAVSSAAFMQPGSLLSMVEDSYRQSLESLQALGHASADDEDFWRRIREAYSCSPSIINLNNGGVAPQPRVVQEAVQYYNRMCNEAPSYYMWRILDQGREPLREKLARIAGCSADELAIQRNSSESLETIIFGLRLKAGDEVVLSKQDYPNMINAWKQRAHREGIILKWVNLELPSEDVQYMVEAYTKEFNPRTKLVHLTHVINWNGQALPVAKIAEVAHNQGIEVLVDGAHSFAHLVFDIPSLKVDYFGTSLHKWLSAPFGSGLLYVRKEKIKNLYPLLAAADPESEDIRKFENLGTRSFPIEHAISHAVDFFEMIGAQRKYDRLYSLQKHWTDQVKSHPKIKLNHPLSRSFSGAIGNVQVVGMKPEEVANNLFEKNKIHAVAIQWENIHGVRITPNVYTTKDELDILAKALLKMANA